MRCLTLGHSNTHCTVIQKLASHRNKCKWAYRLLLSHSFGSWSCLTYSVLGSGKWSISLLSSYGRFDRFSLSFLLLRCIAQNILLMMKWKACFSLISLAFTKAKYAVMMNSQSIHRLNSQLSNHFIPENVYIFFFFALVLFLVVC